MLFITNKKYILNQFFGGLIKEVVHINECGTAKTRNEENINANEFQRPIYKMFFNA